MSYKRNKDSEQIVSKLTREDKNAAMVEIHQALKEIISEFLDTTHSTVRERVGRPHSIVNDGRRALRLSTSGQGSRQMSPHMQGPPRG
jgi:hypothetical protein